MKSIKLEIGPLKDKYIDKCLDKLAKNQKEQNRKFQAFLPISRGGNVGQV